MSETVAWSLSPRRMVGWLHFARQIDRRDAAEFLALSANAARAKPNDLRQKLRELQKD